MMADEMTMEEYVDIKLEMRNAQEDILAKHNLTWKSFKEYELAVTLQVPDDGIVIDGYRLVKVKRDVKQYPANTGLVVGTTTRLELHIAW